MKIKYLNLLLATSFFIAACDSGSNDPTPILGKWDLDEPATIESLKNSNISPEFLEQNAEIYFRPQTSTLVFTNEKVDIPNWGISGTFRFDGKKIKIKNLPKKGNDDTYTTGMELFEFDGNNIIAKDVDQNVIQIYKRSENLQSNIAEKYTHENESMQFDSNGTGVYEIPSGKFKFTWSKEGNTLETKMMGDISKYTLGENTITDEEGTVYKKQN